MKFFVFKSRKQTVTEFANVLILKQTKFSRVAACI